MACYIHYYIDVSGFAQIGLSFTQNWFRLIDVFKNNGYHVNFITNCFKVFLDNKYRIQEKVITVPKKTLFLVLLYLGPLSLQTRAKLRKSLKGILNCCKLQIVFKSQNKLAKANFVLKIVIPKELTSSIVYKFQCGLCNESYYGESVRHFNVKIAEHIGNSPLTRKKVKPKGSSVSDHLLLCKHSPSFGSIALGVSQPTFLKILRTLSSSSFCLTDSGIPATSKHSLLAYWAFAQHCLSKSVALC